MDHFLNKLKKGAAVVTDKAQQALEITRLNAAIMTKNREIKLRYQRMGEMFYSGYRDQNLSPAKEDLLKYCQEIEQIQQEINELNMKINDLKNAKACACGKSVPVEATVCSNCGAMFETKVVDSQLSVKPTKPTPTEPPEAT